MSQFASGSEILVSVEKPELYNPLNFNRVNRDNFEPKPKPKLKFSQKILDEPLKENDNVCSNFRFLNFLEVLN